MINRLKILLDQPEYNALLRLSEQELRNPADEVRLLVRLELIHRGLLPEMEAMPTTKRENFIQNASTC